MSDGNSFKSVKHLFLSVIVRWPTLICSPVEVNNNDNTGERFYQDDENIHENEATRIDTENLGEEEKTMIQDILGFNERQQ